MITTRPRPRRQFRRSLPIPFMPTVAGYGLSWPSTSPQDAIKETGEDALLTYCREECARLELPPVSATGPASCRECKFSSIYGLQSCSAPTCPNSRHKAAAGQTCGNRQPSDPMYFTRPADVPAHQFCTTCGLANLHGPRCFGSDCPKRITI